MNFIKLCLEYCHFNKYFILYTNTGVRNYFGLSNVAFSAKKVIIKVQISCIETNSLKLKFTSVGWPMATPYTLYKKNQKI